ncbi:MAG: hypothetical protein ABSB71_09555 [Candidatus Bathyarchaeia archaeon]|jgi:hypothetical protein
MTEQTETLPSIDGKLFLKKPAPSATRHGKETMAFIAKESGFSSTTTCRRVLYVVKYGSEEIKEALLNGDVSPWFAYNYVLRKQYARLREILKASATAKQIEVVQP